MMRGRRVDASIVSSRGFYFPECICRWATGFNMILFDNMTRILRHFEMYCDRILHRAKYTAAQGIHGLYFY